MRRQTLYLVTITLLFFGANFFGWNIGSQTKPLTMGQILRAIASVNQAKGNQKKVLSEKILNDVRQRKVDFPLTKENETLLRNEGATDELIETIRENSPPLPTPIPTPKPISTPVSTPTPAPKSTPTVSGKEFKNSIGMEFVKIPSGSFIMGSEKGTINEKPVHKVTINYEFYLGKYEVTIGEWKKVMGDIQAELKSADGKFRESDYQPIMYVSWNDAQEFIKKLNAKNDGYEYRLPSEAEWEYAARAGTTTEFAYGMELHRDQANFVSPDAKGKFLEKTVEVGSYQPNAWGLYDMHGNVWEWVEDLYSTSYNFRSLPTDGSANTSVGDSNYRVLRGGAWSSLSLACRSAHRWGLDPTFRYTTYGVGGFRLVARLKVSQNEKSQPTTSNTTSGDNSTTRKNSIGMEFVRIPSGEFMMGSPTSEKGRKDDEIQHRVTISRDFYLGKYEVTQGQWKAVMGNNPSLFSSCGDDCPVEKVSWDNVQEFIKKLNAKNEGTYRLPTEAEWEYAARAGTTTPFGIGDGNNLSSSEANFNGDYPYGNAAKGKCLCKTVAVGSYQPNAWGLYDMHGNVDEWIQDWYGAYSSSAQTNPTGASTDSSPIRRGGSWLDIAASLRSAARSSVVPSFRNGNVGFRLIRQ